MPGSNDAFDSGDGQPTDPQTPALPAIGDPVPPEGLEPLYAGIDEVAADSDEEVEPVYGSRHDLHVDDAFVSAFSSVQERVHDNAVSHGFWDDVNPHTIGCMIGLCHSELSEFLEADRSKDPEQRDPKVPSHQNRTIELADTIIRCMDIAEFLHLPLASALLEKMRVNAARPHKHGKKY